MLRELSDLMEAGFEILQAKKKEQKERSKEAKKKLMLQKKGKDIRLHAMQTLQGMNNCVQFQRFSQDRLVVSELIRSKVVMF